jgi:polysaccharide export outer membrane protein
MKVTEFVAISAVAAILTGCSVVPKAGPNAVDVITMAGSGVDQRYEVFDIDKPLVDVLRGQRRASLFSQFGDYHRSTESTIGVGDTVSVTIWEAPGGVLFAPSAMTVASNSPSLSAGGNRSSTLPDQVVGRDGTIHVPFTDRIKVNGLTARAVEDAIKKSLQGKTSDPQVAVNVTRSLSSAVTVNGEVNNAARVPISVRGDRLLDVVANAGGLRVPVNETDVQLTRGDKVIRVPMLRVTGDPKENIYVRPNDVLTLVRAPRKFLVLGAAGGNAEVPFDSDGVTLAVALSKAGGLLDNRADPAGVFVFRYEPPNIVNGLRPGSLLAAGTEAVPVVYRLNLLDPASLFAAQAFPIYDRDVIYVSNAPLTDTMKIAQVVGQFSGFAVQGAYLAAK